MKNKTGCVCIVPFYNEKKSIFEVLDVLLKIPAIDRIICVDDGSTDGASDLIKKNYPSLTLVVSPKNEGKSQAIKRGA